MFYTSIPQECPTRVSHKSVPQECPTRVSHKSVPQECPTECPTRVSYKSVPQEFPTRVTHKSVLQECPTRVSHKSFLEECPTRVLLAHVEGGVRGHSGSSGVTRPPVCSSIGRALTQARVRFVPCARNPLRRSCVLSARKAGESAICPTRAQPSAEIVRVECAKCRRECDLSGGAGS